MKFLYYLAAIGSPNLDTKINILKNNLVNIYRSINSNFDIMINCYDTNLCFENIISSFNFKFLDNIYVHTKKGILPELWFTNNHHAKLVNYDYIFFILDDVKLLNVEIYKLIYLKNKYNIEFLSPKVLKSTWDYMKDLKYTNLVITNRVEVYCMLLDFKDFNKFMCLNDLNNSNTWGVDYIMSNFQIKCAIFHNNVAEHFLESKSNHELALKQMYTYLKKYGYSSDTEIREKYKDEVIEIINEY